MDNVLRDIIFISSVSMSVDIKNFNGFMRFGEFPLLNIIYYDNSISNELLNFSNNDEYINYWKTYKIYKLPNLQCKLHYKNQKLHVEFIIDNLSEIDYKINILEYPFYVDESETVKQLIINYNKYQAVKNIINPNQTYLDISIESEFHLIYITTRPQNIILNIDDIPTEIKISGENFISFETAEKFIEFINEFYPSCLIINPRENPPHFLQKNDIKIKKNNKDSYVVNHNIHTEKLELITQEIINMDNMIFNLNVQYIINLYQHSKNERVIKIISVYKDCEYNTSKGFVDKYGKKSYKVVNIDTYYSKNLVEDIKNAYNKLIKGEIY